MYNKTKTLPCPVGLLGCHSNPNPPNHYQRGNHCQNCLSDNVRAVHYNCKGRRFVVPNNSNFIITHSS